MSAVTVLVVEDDDTIAFLVQFLLEREGFGVDLARDGRAAEQRVAAMQPPALVILDVMLPYIDGFELLEKIRAREGWEKIPVIMLTAKSQESDIVRALDAGASDYVVKPFQPNELLARVRRLTKGDTA
ncbi:MAG: response regulator [Proteobacteria bacterium]|nr:response regulator [Pseudomonadota bacterium]